MSNIQICKWVDNLRQSISRKAKKDHTKNECLLLSINKKHFLDNWISDNIHYPYARKANIRALSKESGITIKEIESYLIQARLRLISVKTDFYYKKNLDLDFNFFPFNFNKIYFLK